MPMIFRQILGSEKFVYTAVLFMLPITLFTTIGLMTVDDWRHDALWALGLLISGKTLQGVADRIGTPRTAPAPTSSPSEPVAQVDDDSRRTRPIPAGELEKLVKRTPEPPPPIRPGDE